MNGLEIIMLFFTVAYLCIGVIERARIVIEQYKTLKYLHDRGKL